MTRYLSCVLVCTALTSGAVNSQTAPRWLLGRDSRLTFIAIQQGAAFEGRFADFRADVQFDGDQLDTSRLTVTVETASVDTQYVDRDELLRASEFFNVVQWPEARFEARSFTALGGDDYEAAGQLTIRDQTHPLAVPFTFSVNGERAQLVGEVVIPRLRYGVGQGEWADITAIGADVRVRFSLELLR